MGDPAKEFIPTRRTLLSRLKDWKDDQSWREFFNTYWKLIYGVALKAGLTDDEAQEVVQETIITVAKKMPDFKYDPAIGSFKGWLLNITRWRISDQFRKRQRESAGQASSQSPAGDNVKRPPSSSDDSSRTATVERVPDPASLSPELLT